MWEVIEQRLQEMNKTTYWLATETGITRQTFSLIKHGKIKQIYLQKAFKIADVLEIDVNDFRKE